MGTTPWSNDQPRDLILPPGAGPNDPRLFIGPDIPPILQAFYTANYGADTLTAGCILFYTPDGSHYWYQISFHSSITNENYNARGYVNELIGDVAELVIDIQDATNARQTAFLATGSTNALWSVGANGTITSASFIGVDLTVGFDDITNSDYNWANGASGTERSLGRGLIGGIRITSTGALATAITAQTDITQFHLTVDVWAGRTYRIGFQPGEVTTSAANTVWSTTIRRDTALTGATLSFKTSDATNWTGHYEEQWQTSVSETVPLFLSLTRQSGAGTISSAGSPGSSVPRGYLYVEDISDQKNWTNV